MITAKGNAGVTVEVGPINIVLLQKQIDRLVELLGDRNDILWGVIEMLDDIINEALME